jgi:hypothetical protein
LDSVSIDKFIGINENNIKYQTIIKSKTWNDIANHLKNIDILIINDVSTINPQVFDLLNKLMQVACNNKKQFGDKIIICSAYLFSKKVNKSHDFQIFHTNTWIKSNFSHIQLTNKAN